jgi:hypothetical protein
VGFVAEPVVLQVAAYGVGAENRQLGGLNRCLNPRGPVMARQALPARDPKAATALAPARPADGRESNGAGSRRFGMEAPA